MTREWQYGHCIGFRGSFYKSGFFFHGDSFPHLNISFSLLLQFLSNLEATCGVEKLTVYDDDDDDQVTVFSLRFCLDYVYLWMFTEDRKFSVSSSFSCLFQFLEKGSTHNIKVLHGIRKYFIHFPEICFFIVTDKSKHGCCLGKSRRTVSEAKWFFSYNILFSKNWFVFRKLEKGIQKESWQYKEGED